MANTERGPGRGAGGGGFLPAFLRGYRPEWLGHDLLAGLMLAAIAVPEQIATSRLAGMPPESGFYAFIAGAIGFALVGGSRVMSVGADSTIAPIFAAGLAMAATAGGAQAYPALAAAFAVLVGLILVAAGLARAGWLADLLSVPVTTGVLAGISAHIAVGQLPAILGVPGGGGTIPARLATLAVGLAGANPWTLAIGGFVLAASLGAERARLRLPGPLIALAAAALAAGGFHLQARGVAVLGPLAAHLPMPAPPSVTELRDLEALVPLALIVAMVCMMQTAAVARAFPPEGDTPENAGRDFAGVGAGCILSGLAGSFAVNVSPPRTAVVVESGGRSQLASLIAAGVIGVVLAFARGLLSTVPQAALAGVLLFIAARLLRIGEIVRIARQGGTEIWLVVASATLVVVLPIDTGMLLAVVLSVLHSVYVLARPESEELARVPGTTVWWPPQPGEAAEHVPGVLVFAPAAPLNFTNADHICEELGRRLDAAPAPVRLVVIEASGVTDVDYTGARIAGKALARLRARGIDVALARLAAERAQAGAARTGLLAAFGSGRVFRTVEDAVRALGPRP